MRVDRTFRMVRRVLYPFHGSALERLIGIGQLFNALFVGISNFRQTL